MPAAVMPAAFQDVGEALQIGVHIGVRLPERMAHAGLGSQMDAKARFLQSLQRDRACRRRRMQVRLRTTTSPWPAQAVLHCTNYRRPGPMAGKTAFAGKFRRRPGASLTYWTEKRIRSKRPLACCLKFVQPTMDSSFK